MRVDAHHHVWNLTRRDQPWTRTLPTLRRSFDLDELKPALSAQTIERTVVVQTVCVADETPELLRLADAEAVVAGVVGWVSLSAPDVTERLTALRAAPGGRHLVGIRHQAQEEREPGWFARADVRHGLEAVAAAGLVYDLIVRADQLSAAADLVQSMPHLRFVLDHGGKPDIVNGDFDQWRAHMRRLASTPNVAVKLSGLATQLDPPRWDLHQLRPYADELLHLFRPERTMYGSDWPVCLLAGPYTSTFAAAQSLADQLTDTERADLFGNTAAAWYGLPTS